MNVQRAMVLDILLIVTVRCAVYVAIRFAKIISFLFEIHLRSIVFLGFCAISIFDINVIVLLSFCGDSFSLFRCLTFELYVFRRTSGPGNDTRLKGIVLLFIFRFAWCKRDTRKEKLVWLFF